MLRAALAYLRAHWRVLGPVAAVLVAFAGGFIVGRGHQAGPAKLSVEEKATITEKLQSSASEQKITEVKRDTATDEHRVVRKRKVTKPTGEVVETETTISDRGTRAQARTLVHDDLHLDQTATTITKTETKIVQTFRPLPIWRFGLSFGGVLGSNPGTAYGAEVDWRPFQAVPFLVGGRLLKIPGGVVGLGTLSLQP